MPFNPTEQEAIVLNATLGMIDDMVNHVIFTELGARTHDTNLLPRTADTLRLFNVLLRDFLSPVASKGGQSLPFDLPKPPNGDNPAEHTTLFYLRRVCEDPRLGTEIAPLRRLVDEFMAWLETEAFVPGVWLSNISVQVDLRIRRIQFLRICGDIGKHNFVRLGGQANAIRNLLKENGRSITLSDAYLAIPDLWDWFHTHLFAYHASTIAEFLNEIRYAIRAYVEPQARQAYRRIDELRYDFDRHPDIIEPFAHWMYFELMQASLREPNYPRFSVTKSLKSQF